MMVSKKNHSHLEVLTCEQDTFLWKGDYYKRISRMSRQADKNNVSVKKTDACRVTIPCQRVRCLHSIPFTPHGSSTH